MKNKFLMVTVLFFAALVLFVSCEDVQKVELQYSKAKKVDFTVTRIGTTDRYILRWDAVDNAYGYEIYIKQDGKKSFEYVDDGDFGIVDDNGNESTTAFDSDKWYYIADLDTLYGSMGLPAGTYSGCLGVRTMPFGNKIPSDIVWSDPITYVVE